MTEMDTPMSATKQAAYRSSFKDLAIKKTEKQ
jgi:hypothetical protein